MGQVIVDLTQIRKGTKTRPGAVIGFCPECGRKGEMSRDEMYGITKSITIIHTVSRVWGFNVVDRCWSETPMPNVRAEGDAAPSEGGYPHA